MEFDIVYLCTIKLLDILTGSCTIEATWCMDYIYIDMYGLHTLHTIHLPMIFPIVTSYIGMYRCIMLYFNVILS